MTQSNALVVMPAFGNDIEAYVNEVVLPDAMKRLRARVVARNMVTVNNEDESKEVGDTVRVPMPVTFDDVDQFDEINGTTATPISVKKVDVKVDKHFYKQVEFSDMEFTGSMSGSIENALGGMIDVIGRGVNRNHGCRGATGAWVDVDRQCCRQGVDLLSDCCSRQLDHSDAWPD